MFKKILVSVVVLIALIGAISAYLAYKVIYQSNVNLGGKKSEFIYIHTGSKFDDVMQELKQNNILKSAATFEWLAEKKKYKKAIKPGKYRVLANMSNNALINLLKSGLQEKVEITFNGLRTTSQLISRVCRRIEADSMQLYYAFNDDVILKKYGLRNSNVQALFIPNNYQFYWNTSAEYFLEKMYKAYSDFWNKERTNKAAKLKLTPAEVSTLASIVQSEQCCDNDEKKIIAGLYLNRLRMGKELESDPTVIFAIGDFSIQRLSYKQLKVQSVYNTYEHKGLSPGPIAFVQPSSIDAVLNYTPNNFLYMCAKEDLTGKHYFAADYNKHLQNARHYRNALNKRNINLKKEN
jgi:UPF0755 protein